MVTTSSGAPMMAAILSGARWTVTTSSGEPTCFQDPLSSPEGPFSPQPSAHSSHSSAVTSPAMDLRQFHFDLPADLIAHEPVVERGRARLLALRRDTGRVEDRL